MGKGGMNMEERCKHNWQSADNMRFVAGNNNGASADVFCTLCDMGAFTDEHGIVIPHSIAEVGFREEE